MQGTRRVHVQVPHEDFSQRRANVPADSQNLSYGVDQFLGRSSLVHVAGGARLKDSLAVLVFGMHAQNQYGEFRAQALDVSEDVESASSWHGKVQDHRVPVVAL